MSLITNLHHASLIVADTQKALDFYCGLLGIEQCERPDLKFSGAWLQIGQQQIHLLEIDNPDSVEGRPDHVGRDRHLAFGVNDLQAVLNKLDAAEISYTASQSGRKAAFCRDPDGNGVELVEVASEPGG